eukprot:Ihof_evm1s754 gene=Ihof_evmTU1s754
MLVNVFSRLPFVTVVAKPLFFTTFRSLHLTKITEVFSSNKKTKMAMYPPIEPYVTGMLKVDDIHELYYEECGNKNGKPAVFVHGGPGGGCGPHDRCYFDPATYRIILFDQRGSGRSRPHASLKDNTTWHLVSDMEKLRVHLGVEKWLVFGGSWGSCLGLAYAETHPDRVKALILRGIFALRRSELMFFYQEGTSHLFPEYFEKFVEPIPERERFDLISAYHRRLTGDDAEEQMKCAKAWSTYECATSRLQVDPEMIKKAEADQWALAFARIENHYFVNGGFFEKENEILPNAYKLKDIPGTIVQGRYDVVCPAKTAWELHK